MQHFLGFCVLQRSMIYSLHKLTGFNMRIRSHREVFLSIVFSEPFSIILPRRCQMTPALHVIASRSEAI
jgi:hypothetical protein